MRELDRRTLIRAGLAVGGAGVLGGCDTGGARPGSAYGEPAQRLAQTAPAWAGPADS